LYSTPAGVVTRVLRSLPKALQDIVKQKASMLGEVAELEKRKFTLQTEIEASASGAAE